MTKTVEKLTNDVLTITSVSQDTVTDKKDKRRARKNIVVSPIDRFMAKVKKTKDCWIWTGSKNWQGYGQFSVNYKNQGAHRWAYSFFKGPIPENNDVCHSCDNPSCVNPDHLWVGLARENLWDMCKKGRHHSGPNAPHRNLTEEYLRCHPLARKRVG